MILCIDDIPEERLNGYRRIQYELRDTSGHRAKQMLEAAEDNLHAAVKRYVARGANHRLVRQTVTEALDAT